VIHTPLSKADSSSSFILAKGVEEQSKLPQGGSKLGIQGKWLVVEFVFCLDLKGIGSSLVQLTLKFVQESFSDTFCGLA
jgi:hypothetical protein